MKSAETASKMPSKIIMWVGIALGVSMMIPLGVHAYLGGFARYIADDFCTLGTLRRLGFFGSQVNWYENWSGRFSFTFIVNLTQLAGPKLTPILPALALALWLLAVIFLILRWQRWLRTTASIILAFALSGLVIYATLEGSPNVYQSLYWQTGMLTYTLPLILLTAYLGWLLFYADGFPDKTRHSWAIPVSGAAAFVFGGFSETYVSVQTALLIALFILSTIMLKGKKRRQVNAFLGAGIVGSLLAMLVIVIAPGNLIRRGLMPPSPDPLELIKKSLLDVYIFSVISFRRQPYVVVLSVILPGLVGFLTYQGSNLNKPLRLIDWVRWLFPLVVIPVLTAGLILASIMPSEYAISSYPDDRVLIMPVYFLFLGITLWGLSLGSRLRSLFVSQKEWVLSIASLAFGLSVCALLVFGFVSARTLTDQVPIARQYAQAWDKRDLTLKNIAEDQDEPIAVPSLRHMGFLAEIGYDADEWINRCVAQAYGVDAVVAK
jgi:hypothetical protein